MSEEVSAADLVFDRNVIKTGSEGVYMEKGLYVQFERGVEGKPQDAEEKDGFVGIYRRAEDADVGAIYPPSEAVFRRPDEKKPTESLRDLPLPHVKSEPEP